MASQEPIKGLVAAVRNNRELYINRGFDHGVEIGMRFAVLDQKTQPIADPETGETIGAAPIVKTIVKVTRIDGPKLATARTFRTIPAVVSVFASAMGTSPERPETFDYMPDALLATPEGGSMAVAKGDQVVQTTGDEYA